MPPDGDEMESYNVWQDAFDTYQSLPDAVKLAWVIMPPAFLLGLLALVLHYRLATKRIAGPRSDQALSTRASRQMMNSPEPMMIAMPSHLSALGKSPKTK